MLMASAVGSGACTASSSAAPRQASAEAAWPEDEETRMALPSLSV